MSLHHDFVAMETFQSDLVDVMAGWFSRADLNRPQRLSGYSFCICPHLMGSLRKGFMQILQHCVCVGLQKVKKKILTKATHWFPTSGVTEQRDVYSLSSGCHKCQQHTLVVTSRGGRREEDRMLMRTLEWAQGKDFLLTAYTVPCGQRHMCKQAEVVTVKPQRR